jgi:hypothetical protein
MHIKPSVVFCNFPERIDRDAYEDAISQYVSLVSDRAGAIYQVGNVNYPGLSDIDLVVVVNRPAWDNNQFFSPFLRLAAAYRPLFHHEPRFIPSTCMDALEFSSCVHASSGSELPGTFGSRRRLIFGTDLLGERVVDVTSPSWQHCRVLETAFLFHRAFAGIMSGQNIDVVKLMSKATGLRYPMRHLHDLLGLSRDVDFERHVDEARHSLLQTGRTATENERTAASVLRMLESASQRYESNVRRLFNMTKTEDLMTAAASLLRGVRKTSGISSRYLVARHAGMRRYQDAQRQFRITGGSIFATKPYNGSVKPYAQPFASRIASSARWRLSHLLDYRNNRTSSATSISFSIATRTKS